LQLYWLLLNCCLVRLLHFVRQSALSVHQLQPLSVLALKDSLLR
jgi:hypothetical protein